MRQSRSLSRRTTIWLAMLCSLAVCIQVSAANYYVRITGSDLKNGKTAGNAFRTVSKAASTAKSGDKVYIGAGTYTESVTVANAGASNNPIEFIGDTAGAQTGDAGTVTINGGLLTAFNVNGKNYISLSGLRFTGTGTNNGGGTYDDITTDTAVPVVYWQSAVGGQISNCTFVNGKDAIRVKASDVTVSGCTIQDYANNGIYVEDATSKLTLSDSTVMDCGEVGVCIKKAAVVMLQDSIIAYTGDSAIRTESDQTTHTLDIRRCQIGLSREGVHIHGRSKVTLQNCLIGGNLTDGLCCHAGDSAIVCEHCSIIYNGVDGANLDKVSTVTFRNNIVAFNFDDGIVKGGASHNYNLVYANYGGNYELTAAGTGCLNADPKFVSLSDLRLQSSSPAINAGTGSMIDDLDGNSRPVGPQVDMGCYEYGSTGGGAPGSHDYYVRAGGNDSNSGKSAAQAFRTISKAVSVVQPGDRVWVGAGTYVEVLDLSAKVGTAPEPIIFTADTSGAKTGDAGVVNVNGGFYATSAAYITVEGFTIRVSNSKPTWCTVKAGAYAGNSSNITFQNLVVDDGEYGVYGSAVTTMVASGCTVTDSSKHGFYFQTNCTADVLSCTSSSNSLAGFYSSACTVNMSSCAASSNGTRGYHYVSSQGSILNSSSTNNYLAAELVGVNNDRNSLIATNMLVQGCAQGAVLLQHSTADVYGGASSLTSGGTYTAHVTNGKLTIRNATISGTTYGVQAYGNSQVILTSCQLSSCPSDGVYLDGSTASLTSCTVTGCGRGVYGVNNSTVNASTCTFNSQTNWAINNSGFGSVTDCVINSNGQGMYLIGATNRGDITISGTAIQNSAREGLTAVRCTGSLALGNAPLAKSGAYGIYLLDSALTVPGVTINSTQYGVQAFDSVLNMTGATIAGCSYDGVYMDDSTASLQSCTISNCRQGIWSENNGTLDADLCVIANHTSWGINHTGYGSVDNCEVKACAKGVYLAGASLTGDITVANTSIQATAEGLAAIRCTGNIIPGADKLSKGGAYGMYLSESQLQATGISVSGSQYGIQSFESTLNLTNGVISGCSMDGVYADQASTTLTGCTISSCRYGVRSENNGSLVATGSTFATNGSWGIRHSGTGSISNCVSDRNYQGMYLAGATATGDVTLTNVTIQGTTREGLHAVRCTGNLVAGNDKLSKGGDYGVYLSESTITIANCQITGPTYGVMSYSSTLNLTGSSISDCSTDGIYANQATTTLGNCTIARCNIGVNSDTAGTLNATACTFDDCNSWGVYHAGYGAIADCLINNCEQGMYLSGVSQNTDITLSNTKIQGSAKDGLVAEYCSGEIVAGTSNLSNGGTYGAYLSDCDLTLTGIAVTGSQRGIVALNSTVELSNGAVSNTTQTGIYTEGSTATLTNCVVSGCGSRGVDCQLDSTLNATDLVVQNCGDWGLGLSGFGVLDSCQLTNNQRGANLVGKASRGDIAVVDLIISGIANQGLFATRCVGTVQGGAQPLSQGGIAGVQANDSQLLLTAATISGSTNGIESTLSDLTVRGVSITNVAKGVYSDRDQNLVLDTTRISNCSAWGLHQIQGNTQTMNCVVGNSASGLFLDAAAQARVWNSTIVATGQYGVYQNAGTADIKNTIIAGSDTGTGMYKVGGALTMANNLVHGFSTNFSGVTADASTVSKNPQFTDISSGDYTLAKGSPAINAGYNLTGLVDADFAGSSRPAFKRWDIGAYEYLQSDASLRILQWAEKK